MWNIIIWSIGIIGSLIILYYYLFSPVEKNRYLYGNQPTKMILSIVFAIVVGFCLFSSIFSTLSTTSSEIVNWSENALVEKNSASPNEDLEKKWAILSQFADPGNLPSAHGNGRWIALISAVLGIISLSGFLVSSLVNFISRRSEKWKKGLIHYRPHKFLKWKWGLHKFVVIIGVNDQTIGIAKQALKRTDVDYVLIQTRQDVERMRMKLDLGLDKKEENKIIFYYAERTSVEDISLLHVEYATEVYILGEDISCENEEDHDAFNIECLNLISNYVQKHRKERKGMRLKCNVDFEYQGTFTAFKVTHIYKNLDRFVEFVPFNIHEQWAKKVLVDNFAIIPGKDVGEKAVQTYRPLDDDGIGIDSEKTVHLVIMGMNQMGTAMAVQAALLAHYPNFARDHKKKTTISFIDDHAIEEGEYFRGRFTSLFEHSFYREININENEQIPHFTQNANIDSKNNEDVKRKQSHLVVGEEDLMDIQWEFIQGNVASPKITKYLNTIANDSNKIMTVAICFNRSQQSIATALYMSSNVLRRANQILVYQQSSFDILKTVANGDLDWKRYKNMVPFGMVESSYDGDSYDDMLAKMEHYTYVAKRLARERKFVRSENHAEEPYHYECYKYFHGKPSLNYELIESIEQTWEELGIVQKLANIDMVESIPSKLRSMDIPYNGNTQHIKNFFKCVDIKDKDRPDEIRRRFNCFAQSEHMRWMVERLIMGYRALKPEEQSLFGSELKKEQRERISELLGSKLEDSVVELTNKQKLELKEILKTRFRAHLDICSNKRLIEVDRNMMSNDLDVIAYLPLILSYKEWAIIMKYINDDRYRRDHHELRLILDNPDNLSLKYVKRKQYPTRVEKDKNLKKKFESPDNKDIISNHNFWISDFNVTQEQWKKIMGQKKNDWSNKLMPVVNVSKDEIEDFLLVLRKKTGLYFALPSLREWKYAAMLSTGYLDGFPIISDAEDDKLRKFICFDSNKPLRKRKKQKNLKGINDIKVYGMLGNVWEWTRTSPKEKHHNKCFYFCGGSWQFKKKECDLYSDQEYWYSFWLPKLKSKDVGFRLVWKLDSDTLSKSIMDSSCEFIKKQKSNTLFGKFIDTKFYLTPRYPYVGQIKYISKKKEQIEKWLNKHMVDIPGGYFMMGTENTSRPTYIIDNGDSIKEVSFRDKDNNIVDYPFVDPKAGDEETPHHYVRISSLKMCDVPVTQELWNIVMGIAPKDNPSKNTGNDFPQTNVSYRTIVDEFLRRLNILYKKEEREFRLPTEAEFEFVAKGGCNSDFAKKLQEEFSKFENDKAVPLSTEKKEKAFPDGVLLSLGSEKPYTDYSGSDDPNSVAWYNCNSTQRVNQKTKNACNIYDMSGNVWEWILDYYQTDFYLDCIAGKVKGHKYGNSEYKDKGYITNPVCREDAYSAHVFRGGSYCFTETDCRCTSVNFWVDTDEDEDLGFRLVEGKHIALGDFQENWRKKIKRRIKNYKS